MQQEIEAKFLNQDHDEIRQKLKALGAICEYPMKLVRRTVMDFPDRSLLAKRAWVRLREELDGTIELMLKQVADDALGETFEQAVTVTEYEAAKRFAFAIGLEVKSEQESKREVWRLGDAEIMLDEWPWVKPYIEIEANSKELVIEIAKKLSLDWSAAKFGGITPVYTAEFDLTAEEFESIDISIKFNQPVPVEYKKRATSE